MPWMNDFGQWMSDTGLPIPQNQSPQGQLQQFLQKLTNPQATYLGTMANYNLGMNQLGMQPYLQQQSIAGQLALGNQQNLGAAYQADSQRQASMYGADAGRQASNYGYDTQYRIAEGQDKGQTTRQGMVNDTNKLIAELQAAVQREQAKMALEGSNYSADKQYQGIDTSSQRNLEGIQDTNAANRYATEQALKGQLYGFDTSRANTQDTNRAQLEQTRLQTQAQNVPAYLQQDRFGAILPYLVQVLQSQMAKKPNLGTMG